MRYLILVFLFFLSNFCLSQCSDTNRSKPTYWIYPYLNNNTERIRYHRTQQCNDTQANCCYSTSSNSYFLTDSDPIITDWPRQRQIRGTNAELIQEQIDNRYWETVPVGNIRQFSRDRRINNVLIDLNVLALLNQQQNEGDDIPIGRYYQINFPIDSGQTVLQVTRRIQTWASNPNGSYPDFLLALNDLNNNPNLNIEIEGHASNSWGGFDKSQYTSRAQVCSGVLTNTDLANGDFDGGGVTNGIECNRGTNPLRAGDDNPPIDPSSGQPIICPATIYNNQLAQLRLNSAVQWFLTFYQNRYGQPFPPGRLVQNASGITNNSTRRSVIWNQDQNVTFRIR